LPRFGANAPKTIKLMHAVAPLARLWGAFKPALREFGPSVIELSPRALKETPGRPKFP